MKVFHSDHGVSEALISWALAQVSSEGFFIKTLEIPASEPDLQNGLYGPESGDQPIHEGQVYYRCRGDRKGPSRLIRAGTRPTRLLTVIGVKSANDEETTVYTAFGGPSAKREPWDPSLSPEERVSSAAFWAHHALASTEVPGIAGEKECLLWFLLPAD